MTMPWLSVIVPVYNGRRYLTAALDSVLAQTDQDVEILVTDDGSTDGSLDIIDTYARQGKIIPISGPRLGNWVTNSNQAVDRARGQVVTFLHQDDLWLPARLARLREACKRNPGGQLWIGPTRFIDPAGRIAGNWNLPFKPAAGSLDARRFVEHLLVQNFLGMPAPAFSRNTYKALGGMDERLWFAADWDLWIRLGAEAPVLVDLQATTGFRLHGESQTMVGADDAESMRLQTEAVRARHLWRVLDPKDRDAIDRAGHFAAELNASLASAWSRQPIRWSALLRSFSSLGMRGGYRFARDARFIERVTARVRLALNPAPPDL
jgi:glycosyltransferase involved in cell wall biosynthesis